MWRHVRHRVRRLTERDHHGASPDEFEYLFIVTYGRSGSTLLMSLLDSLPGYCIRGENNGVVYDLFKYYSKLADAKAKWSRGRRKLAPQHPWYGIDGYSPNVAVDHMRRLVLDSVLRPEPGTRVTGFKEIRWWMPEPVEYLDFIETLFPGARFILNTRNLDDVAESKWWRRKPDAAAALTKVEERLKDTVARRGDRGYHIHFDEYVENPEVLKGLYDWLGVEYDAEQVQSVLGTRHSF